ncbi:hypothetical protein JTB14_009734 [Gonioctena quinquepunctata]|nr:hypothetical protein JTB14_009734 [Gonioctena quinquepunctata]
MADEICENCNFVIKDGKEAICCDRCREYFHYNPVEEENCSSISATEYRARVLQQRKNILFCSECRGAFKNVPIFIRQISSLKNEVQSLEEDMQELKIGMNLLPSRMLKPQGQHRVQYARSYIRNGRKETRKKHHNSWTTRIPEDTQKKKMKVENYKNAKPKRESQTLEYFELKNSISHT